MIPTTYKAKLSHLMSYSVNASTLSTALENVPQIQELSIGFSASCQHPKHLREPCYLLYIYYSYPVPQMSGPRSVPQWNIWVYPVPRERVKEVKDKLEEEGFEKLRQWFNARKDVTVQYGSCRLELYYNMNNRVLSYREKDDLL